MKGLGQADETRDQCRPLRAHALSPWGPPLLLVESDLQSHELKTHELELHRVSC